MKYIIDELGIEVEVKDGAPPELADQQIQRAIMEYTKGWPIERMTPALRGLHAQAGNTSRFVGKAPGEIPEGELPEIELGGLNPFNPANVTAASQPLIHPERLMDEYSPEEWPITTVGRQALKTAGAMTAPYGVGMLAAAPFAVAAAPVAAPVALSGIGAYFTGKGVVNALDAAIEGDKRGVLESGTEAVLGLLPYASKKVRAGDTAAWQAARAKFGGPAPMKGFNPLGLAEDLPAEIPGMKVFDPPLKAMPLDNPLGGIGRSVGAAPEPTGPTPPPLDWQARKAARMQQQREAEDVFAARTAEPIPQRPIFGTPAWQGELGARRSPLADPLDEMIAPWSSQDSPEMMMVREANAARAGQDFLLPQSMLEAPLEPRPSSRSPFDAPEGPPIPTPDEALAARSRFEFPTLDERLMGAERAAWERAKASRFRSKQERAEWEAQQQAAAGERLTRRPAPEEPVPPGAPPVEPDVPPTPPPDVPPTPPPDVPPSPVAPRVMDDAPLLQLILRYSRGDKLKVKELQALDKVLETDPKRFRALEAQADAAIAAERSAASGKPRKGKTGGPVPGQGPAAATVPVAAADDVPLGAPVRLAEEPPPSAFKPKPTLSPAEELQKLDDELLTAGTIRGKQIARRMAQILKENPDLRVKDEVATRKSDPTLDNLRNAPPEKGIGLPGAIAPQQSGKFGPSSAGAAQVPQKTGREYFDMAKQAISTPGERQGTWTRFKNAADNLTRRGLATVRQFAPKAYEKVGLIENPEAKARMMLMEFQSGVEADYARHGNTGGDAFSQFATSSIESQVNVGAKERWYDLSKDFATGTKPLGLAHDIGTSMVDDAKKLAKFAAKGAAQASDPAEAARLQAFSDKLKQQREAFMAALSVKNRDAGQIRSTGSALAKTLGDAISPPDPTVLAHIQTPEYQAALARWKPMAAKLKRMHLDYGGAELDPKYFGPMGEYFPLVANNPGGFRGLLETMSQLAPWRERMTGHQAFRTGHATSGYTNKPELLFEDFKKFIRAANLKQFHKLVTDARILVSSEPGHPLDYVYWHGGQKVGLVPVRGAFPQLIANMEGRVTGKKPEKLWYVIEPAYRELKPVFETLEQVVGWRHDFHNAIVGASLYGPNDAIANATNLMNAMTFRIPLLGKSVWDRALSIAPVKFIGVLKKVIEARPFELDPATGRWSVRPEWKEHLDRLTDIGGTHPRWGQASANEALAEQFGGEFIGWKKPGDIARKILQVDPLLYGPNGLDIRVRLAMSKIMKDFYPEVWNNPAEYNKVMSWAGRYGRASAGGFERFLKDWGIGPFATAAMQGTRNAMMGFVGAGLPKGTPVSHRMVQLTNSGIGAIATWFVVFHMVNGRWPEPGKDRFLEIEPSPAQRKRFTAKALSLGEPGTRVVPSQNAAGIQRGARGFGVDKAWDYWDDKQRFNRVFLGIFNQMIGRPAAGVIPQWVVKAFFGKETYAVPGREGASDFLQTQKFSGPLHRMGVATLEIAPPAEMAWELFSGELGKKRKLLPGAQELLYDVLAPGQFKRKPAKQGKKKPRVPGPAAPPVPPVPR